MRASVASGSGRTAALLAGLAVAAVWMAGCGEKEKPVWAFGEGAVEAIDFEHHLRRVPGDELPLPDAGCRQVLAVRLDDSFPDGDPTPAGLRELLGGASRIETHCAGSCGDDPCRVQHFTAMREKMQKAKTRCMCDPQDEPPCDFKIEWELGDESRRRILGLSCEAVEGVDACGFLVAGDRRQMQLTCSAAQP